MCLCYCENSSTELGCYISNSVFSGGFSEAEVVLTAAEPPSEPEAEQKPVDEKDIALSFLQAETETDETGRPDLAQDGEKLEGEEERQEKDMNGTEEEEEEEEETEERTEVEEEEEEQEKERMVEESAMLSEKERQNEELNEKDNCSASSISSASSTLEREEKEEKLMSDSDSGRRQVGMHHVLLHLSHI